MFTGIVTDLARVRAVRRGTKAADTRFEIATAYDMRRVPIGASIACSGPCLTVVAKGRGWFAVEASAETLSRTTLGDWRVGTAVNLERAMTPATAFDGHVVTGHVDAVVPILRRTQEGGSWRFEIALPKALAPFVAEKGSVCLDGVSLTVNEVGRGRFGINVIRHTAEKTAFGTRRPGERLNMEVDVLARYVARQLSLRRR